MSDRAAWTKFAGHTLAKKVKPRVKFRMRPSLEDDFEYQLKLFRFWPVREYHFDKKRRWRFDFAWPSRMVAVEIEGGHWVGGRHTRGAGFDKDCEKYAEAAIQGWRVLRVTSTHIKSGQALDWLDKLLAARA